MRVRMCRCVRGREGVGAGGLHPLTCPVDLDVHVVEHGLAQHEALAADHLERAEGHGDVRGLGWSRGERRGEGEEGGRRRRGDTSALTALHSQWVRWGGAWGEEEGVGGRVGRYVVAGVGLADLP